MTTHSQYHALARGRSLRPPASGAWHVLSRAVACCLECTSYLTSDAVWQRFQERKSTLELSTWTVKFVSVVGLRKRDDVTSLRSDVDNFPCGTFRLCYNMPGIDEACGRCPACKRLDIDCSACMQMLHTSTAWDGFPSVWRLWNNSPISTALIAQQMHILFAIYHIETHRKRFFIHRCGSTNLAGHIGLWRQQHVNGLPENTWLIIVAGFLV